ncbi:MAG: HD-GYP domain-containing protein [Betaproteobacteria bacterium]
MGEGLPQLVAWINYISILIVLGISAWTYQEINQLIQRTDASTHHATAQTLGGAVADKMLTRDYASLEAALRLFLYDRQILSVAALDMVGRPLVYLHRSSAQEEPKLLFLSEKLSPPPSADYTDVRNENDHTQVIWHQISSGVPLGWIRVEVSNEQSYRILSSLLSNVLLIGGLVLVLSMLFSTLYFLRNHVMMRRQQTELAKKEVMSSHEVVRSHIAMMEALGHAIAKRDSDTGDHNYRVTWMATKLGETLGINLQEMQRLIVGSFLHDIGKVGIPDSILLKPGSLTEEEMAIMRTHVMHGVDMVRGMGWLHDAYDVVAFHHEKWNGTGYPNGVAGLDIPLVARIFAVADVFDALYSKRPYKQSLQLSEVLNTIRDQSGIHFDPDILVRFLAIAPELHAQMESPNEFNVTLAVQAKVQHYFYKSEGMSPLTP